MAKGDEMKQIHAKFIGYQVWRQGRFALYNLLEPVGEHPIHSTVSLHTLHVHGCEPFEGLMEVEK